MTTYVSCNRLRLRMVGGVVGTGGTAASASGLYNVIHGLGTPTIFGAVPEMSNNTVANVTKQVKCRLSGTAIVCRCLTGIGSTAAASATSVFRWFAAE